MQATLTYRMSEVSLPWFERLQRHILVGMYIDILLTQLCKSVTHLIFCTASAHVALGWCSQTQPFSCHSVITAMLITDMCRRNYPYLLPKIVSSWPRTSRGWAVTKTIMIVQHTSVLIGALSLHRWLLESGFFYNGGLCWLNTQSFRFTLTEFTWHVSILTSTNSRYSCGQHR